MKAYKTIQHSSEVEIVIRKSRFIGRAFPVQDEIKIKNIISKIKNDQLDATHHCFGYVLDENSIRFSDDGEPGGTAGLPIVEVIKAKELRNVLIVVTRYFGGVLLGAGGLVRAYSKSASNALQQAGISIMLPSLLLELDMSYSQWNKWERILIKEGYWLDAPLYKEFVRVKVLIQLKDRERFFAQIQAWSDGQLKPREMGEIYKAWIE